MYLWDEVLYFIYCVFIFDLFDILRWYFITKNSYFIFHSCCVTYIKSENTKYCRGVTSKEISFLASKKEKGLDQLCQYKCMQIKWSCLFCRILEKVHMRIDWRNPYNIVQYTFHFNTLFLYSELCNETE